MDILAGFLIFFISSILALVVYAGFIRFVTARKIKNRIILYAGPSIILGCLVLINGGVASLSSDDGRFDRVLLTAISMVIASFLSIAISVSVFEFIQKNRK